MADFDYPHALADDYTRVLLRRVQAATDSIEWAFERLKRAERADPAHWEALLREAERAFNRAYPPESDQRLAAETVRRIERFNAEAWREEHPELVAQTPGALTVNPSTLFQHMRDLVDAMRALIRQYYSRLRKPETDDSGIILFPLLGASIALAAGISRRKGEFYARDQTGNIYHDVALEQARNVGVRKYEWMRTTSKNPRRHHLQRVGNVYTIDDPPADGHPGTQVNCKCGMRWIVE